MSATMAAKKLFRSFSEARAKKSVYQRIREYSGHINVHYETDDFVVRTAESGQELLKVLELRHQIFIEEWQGRKAFHGLDVDGYDFSADHLMIIDKRRNETVGTYRLLSSLFTSCFYSAGEFQLDEFLKIPGVKLELGRACVHSEYRNGNTIDLLWKGLARYIFFSRTENLFGCASVKTTDPELLGRIYQSLRDDDRWSDEYAIRSTLDYRFPGFNIHSVDVMSAIEKRELLPPLLRSYLHAGAKVYGWPALDTEFACADLLTILPWNDLNPKFRARFLKFD